MSGYAVGKQLKVTFQKTGGVISHEEFRIRSERDKPAPFQPFEIGCRILSIPTDALCVITKKSVCLSNGNGITVPSKVYCLRKDGTVAYFYNGNIEEWHRNIPIWSADWSDQIRQAVFGCSIRQEFADLGASDRSCSTDCKICL